MNESRAGRLRCEARSRDSRFAAHGMRDIVEMIVAMLPVRPLGFCIEDCKNTYQLWRDCGDVYVVGHSISNMIYIRFACDEWHEMTLRIDGGFLHVCAREWSEWHTVWPEIEPTSLCRTHISVNNGFFSDGHVWWKYPGLVAITRCENARNYIAMLDDGTMLHESQPDNFPGCTVV